MTSKTKRLYKKRQKFPAKWANSYTTTVNIGLLTHPVFLSLKPATKLVYLVMEIENQRAAHNKNKEDGRPYFEWSAYDSEKHLKISRRHHFNSIKELKDKGFIKVLQEGGLLGCNGIGNIYTLSPEWTRHQLPPRATTQAVTQRMEKARACIGQKPENEASQVKPSKPENATTQVKKSKNLESFKNLPPYLSWEQPQSGMRAYKRGDSVRATQIKLVEPINDSTWLIQLNRKDNKSAFRATALPFADIISVDQIKPNEYRRPE